MDIRIISDDLLLHGSLADNATARHFAALLPLALDIRDFDGRERIADLPVRLDPTDAPAVHKGRPGCIEYFAPWGNLALFYGTGPFTGGLIHVGTLAPDDVSLLTQLRGPVTIEVDDPPAPES